LLQALVTRPAALCFELTALPLVKPRERLYKAIFVAAHLVAPDR